ncbi:YcjF family protein [Paracoccus seriniphilus]|uniref:Putative membrane protein n=1 Tax=Paracoccus seriniphilus TaxID=184748 RepID=A0A239PSV7_9RHOB|nr:TIGR01620 family protein [Paracoccus seriniphilus]WCR14301.1 TIGR01620 family protein [Paracoccus seriniphilus]SNT72996.1 putative membrane protein [Paracoccus seriniphilus]
MTEDKKPTRRRPVLVEIEDSPQPERDIPPRTHLHEDPGPNPADAPPIDNADPVLPRPRTMEMVTRLVGRPPSKLTRFFINSGVALFTFLLSIAALDFINNLLNSYPVLGWIGIALFALFTLAALGMAWREYRAWARFAKIDAIQRQAGAALAEDSIEQARKVCNQLQLLYRDRPELQWQRQRLADQKADIFDANSLLTMAETELMAPLDQQARREIEAAARTVAAATALIPLALADVAAALAANLRMIRRMAEIYGGRAGAVGGWRLARTVMTHLVATGAVAAGDDLIHTVAGGGVLAKLSRRFGEGVVNGALTARVGIAAMEVCRPLPFMAQPRPRVGNLVTRGLRGLFGESPDEAGKSPPRQD